jgi:hypothetical protein
MNKNYGVWRSHYEHQCMWESLQSPVPLQVSFGLLDSRGCKSQTEGRPD